MLLATGGASGLTAHLVEILAAGSRPHGIWLLGSSPEPTGSAEPLPAKPELIRRLMAEHPGEKLAEVTRRYERMARDAERRRTIATLSRLTGPAGVHYLQCDVLDESAVRTAVGSVLERAGRIDVVVHGAGLTRSASLARKQPADFREVRDVKVRGYLNLRKALAGRGSTSGAVVQCQFGVGPRRHARRVRLLLRQRVPDARRGPGTVGGPGRGCHDVRAVAGVRDGLGGHARWRIPGSAGRDRPAVRRAGAAVLRRGAGWPAASRSGRRNAGHHLAERARLVEPACHRTRPARQLPHGRNERSERGERNERGDPS